MVLVRGPDRPADRREEIWVPPPAGEPVSGTGDDGAPGPPTPTPPRRGRSPIPLTTIVVVVVVAIAVATVVRMVEDWTAPSPGAVAVRVDPAVVDIVSRLAYQEMEAAGTGMVLTGSGEVLTNNHVIEGATAIEVTDVGNGRSYRASVVGTDPAADVAVLQLQGASGLRRVTVASHVRLAVGAPVLALGNARGRGGTPSEATGSVTALHRSIVASDFTGVEERLSDLIQTDAPLQSGDSGGPLVTGDGRVVGMNTATSGSFTFQSGAGAAYAIPIATAVAVARQIESGVASSTVHIGPNAFLGVAVRSTTSPPGAVVVAVAAESPAQLAGLVPGDVVTWIDGGTVRTAQGVADALWRLHPGDTVRLGWIDAAGQGHTAAVDLTVGPAD